MEVTYPYGPKGTVRCFHDVTEIQVEGTTLSFSFVGSDGGVATWGLNLLNVDWVVVR